nr:MAG TPA: cytochrome c-552 [Caudoviricetes sp.]
MASTLAGSAYTSLCGYTARADLSQTPTIGYMVLTPCCQAKVIDDHLCAGCHKVAPIHCESRGWGALFAAAKAYKCPRPMECADHMLWQIDRELEAQQV